MGRETADTEESNAANFNVEFNVAGLTHPPNRLNCTEQIPSTGGMHGTSAFASVGLLRVNCPTFTSGGEVKQL